MLNVDKMGVCKDMKHTVYSMGFEVFTASFRRGLVYLGQIPPSFSLLP